MDLERLIKDIFLRWHYKEAFLWGMEALLKTNYLRGKVRPPLDNRGHMISVCVLVVLFLWICVVVLGSGKVRVKVR